MSVLSGLGKADLTTASDGLLELPPEKLRSIMRSEPITDVYHVEQTPFARGKFASVRKIRHLVSGQEYAAKFIRKRRRAADTSREIHHEVAVLALCSGCERVVRLHEVYETRTEVAIVLELCAGGELQRLLDEEERLAEGSARRALRHVLEGLRHLHARRVAHLDLKPQNLLLSARRDHLLICDFGISRAIHAGAHVREILGTRDYVAPEILSYEPLTLAADVWSVGVLAYVLLSGYSPFAGDTKQETYLNIAQGSLSFPPSLFRGVSRTAIQFIKDTLVVDPKGRLTVEECLEHPWLKDASDLPTTIVGVGFNTATADSDPDTENEPLDDNTVNNGTTHDIHGTTNGVNGTTNGINASTNCTNGTKNGTNIIINGTTNAVIGTTNAVNATTNAVNGTTNSVNGTTNSVNGTTNVVNGTTNAVNGTTNAVNGTTNAVNGKTSVMGTVNAINGTTNAINGATNGIHGSPNGKICTAASVKNGTPNCLNGTTNGFKSSCNLNGSKSIMNGSKSITNGVNGCNGTHDYDKDPVCPEELGSWLKHRELPPPFPDAPSTPKVLRKSPCASVLALCKKFQADGDPPAGPHPAPHSAPHPSHPAPAAPCACGRAPCVPRRPDRALLC